MRILKKILIGFLKVIKWILIRILICIGFCFGLIFWAKLDMKFHPDRFKMNTNERGKKYYYFEGNLQGKKCKRFRKRG
jgi:hypothetical protein